MAVRGDEVADRIEAKIREAVNRMMQEVRTSISDVREAIEQQLDAALQSVQADINAFAFRGPLEDGIRQMEADYAEQLKALPRGATSDAVKQSIRSIESGKNQVEILSALLDESLHFGSRSVLLILKGDTFSGWKAAGFSAHGGNDEALRRFTAGRDAIPQFDQLLREERSVIWNGQNLATRFGVSSSRAALIPMVIKDKIAAAVYVDATEEDAAKFDQSAIELLVFTTGLLVDTLAIRKKVPSPSLSAPVHTFIAPAAEAPSPPPAAAETLAARPGAPATPPPPPAMPEEPAPPPAPESPRPPVQPIPPARTFELQTEPAAERSWPRQSAPEEPEAESNFATAMFPRMDAPAATASTAAPTSAAELADRASTQYIPPPGLTRGGAFAPKTDEEKKHEEARRFARLLVSEIKLYNESQVEQGRRDKDLYERLKEDIDRSRQMYDDRVPDDVRKGTNYFYEELVHILADGNREALGL